MPEGAVATEQATPSAPTPAETPQPRMSMDEVNRRLEQAASQANTPGIPQSLEEAAAGGEPTPNPHPTENSNRHAESQATEREIPKSTLMEETRTVAHAAISQKAEQVVASGNTSGYGENVLVGIHLINNAGENTELPFRPDDSLKFKRGDQDMEMIGATANRDGTFRCSIQAPGDPDSAEMATFTRDELIDAIITSDERTTNAVINLLPESQREIVSLHVDITENGESALAGKTAEQLSQLITKGAKSADLITTNEMLAKANNVPQAQREEFLGLLEGQNIVTGETLNRFLQMTDLNGLVASGQAEVRAAQAALADRPGNEDLREALEIRKAYLERFTQMAEMVRTGQAKEYIDRLAKGQVDKNTASTLKSAIMSENMDDAVDALFPELRSNGSDTPEEAAAKARKKRESRKKAETIGWLALAAALVGAMALGELGKGVTGGR